MASKRGVHPDQTIVIGGNTYKRSFVQFSKNLSFLVALACYTDSSIFSCTNCVFRFHGIKAK